MKPSKFLRAPRAAHLLAVPCAFAVVLSCQTDAKETNHSGATNWLRCETTADCSEAPGATCADDGYCRDAAGRRIESRDATDPVTDDDVSNLPTDDDGSPDDDPMDDGSDAPADDDSARGDDDSGDDDSDAEDDGVADDDAMPPIEPLEPEAPAGADAGPALDAGPSGGAGGAPSDPTRGDAGACDFDSCHPERCDEAGEPCCDPFPGDGVNYCNGGLTCQGGSCILRADTTTPEALARQACETTAGVWNVEACGHALCGTERVCGQLQPGCDCGEGRNFVTEFLGCQEDPECGTASQAFDCGELTCTGIGTRYCEVTVNGPGVTTACQAIPEPCLQTPTCVCLLEQLAETNPPTQCSLGDFGELVVEPPGNP